MRVHYLKMRAVVDEGCQLYRIVSKNRELENTHTYHLLVMVDLLDVPLLLAVNDMSPHGILQVGFAILHYRASECHYH